MFARHVRITFAALLLGSAAVTLPTFSAFAQADPPAAGDPPRQIVVDPAPGQPPAGAPADDPLEGLEIPGVIENDGPAGQVQIQLQAPADQPAAVIAAPAAPAATLAGEDHAAALAQLAPQYQRPSDPIAAAAWDVLDKHCARCHQAGLLVGHEKPAKNFGNVLDLSSIASDPIRIAPGNPDGSKIVQQLLNQEMPYDIYYEANFTYEPPTETDIAALRTWIESLGTAVAEACSERDFITPVEMTEAMARDVQTLSPTRVADTRYITLTHLYTACATDEEMEVYRQGAVKILNSLSRVSDVVRLETIDEAGTIIRFNLKDLGWTSEDWDKVISVYPYATRPDSPMFDFVSSATLSMLPYVRGDWFAFTAGQPPLYEELLGLPSTFGELQQKMNLDIAANLDRFIARRAGVQLSGVSQNNRMIERHPIATGYFWTSYDFAGNRDKQSIFEFPLGPGDGEFAFHHDGGETIFSLPNGFQGYYLNTSDGKHIPKGPTTIVRDLSRRDLTVTNGISCFGCHDQGIRKMTDVVRETVLSSRTFPRSVRDAVEALYPTNEEMAAILEQDGLRFTNAMRAAGLDPTLKLNGVEMINALAAKYENALDIRLAAAEFGQSLEEFEASLAGAAIDEATRLQRRLAQGLVPRDNFEGIYDELVPRVSDAELIDVASLKQVVGETPIATVADVTPVESSHSFDFAVTSDRSDYAVGDLPIFTVVTKKDCYLTLINVDAAGKATVIYPNSYQQQNFITAGQDFLFPAPDAPFQFRFADHGEEAVIAVCSLENKPVDEISHDFREAAFTDLGNYEQFVGNVTRTRQILIEARQTQGAAVAPPTTSDIVVRSAIKLQVQ